ncbi:MAG: alpha-L-fucosidase [Fimbriimonadaceae bacterium]
MISLLVAASLMGTPAQQPLPTKRQLAWHEMGYYAFVHFGPNTFTDKEWGEGREDPKVFNPTAFDARQWVRTFKAAGMKGVIITAKHHDGFCLWPSKLSKHTVAQSPWKRGKGDVLKELSEACKAEGLKMGVYLSPWDRNHPAYGTPEYNKVFAGMLKEVLTQYGPIFEVWFDGANGEGPNGKRQIYDWELFVSTVRKYQPSAVIFSDAGPDVRWVGNEGGIAGETNWATMDRSKVTIGGADQAYLNVGDPLGRDWVPAECDVSIRPGWFYHASEDSKVKSVEKLLEIWHASVGRGANLLLNVPPDRRGLIHENDVAALNGLKQRLDVLYGRDLAIKREALRQEVTIEVPPEKLVDRLVIVEDLKFGQRVTSFTIRASGGMAGAGWTELASGTTIGQRRIVVFPPLRAKKLRVSMHALRPGEEIKIKLVQVFGPNEE